MDKNVSTLWSNHLTQLIDKIDEPAVQQKFRNNLYSLIPVEIEHLEEDESERHDIYHVLYMEIQNYLGFSSQRDRFYEIESLNDVLVHLKTLPARRTIVFFDWDDTIVYSGTTDIIEPEVTKNLFNYMLDMKIDFVFITARYWNYVIFNEFMTDDDYDDIKTSVIETIHEPLKTLGFEPETNILEPVFVDHQSDRVGLYYLNILFGCEKGRIITSYKQKLAKSYDHVLFVDDYDEYLINVGLHVPQATLIRRKIADTV